MIGLLGITLFSLGFSLSQAPLWQDDVANPYLFARRFAPPQDTRLLRTIENNAFRVGEHLVFDIKYGIIKAGEGIFSVPMRDTLYGRQVYHVSFRARSNSAFDIIYKVDDRFDTFIDTAGIFPWRFSQRLREGKFKSDYSADFDQANNTAYSEKAIIKTPPYVHDVVSAFFYVRTIDFSSARMGQRYNLNNFYRDSTYDLAVRYLGTQRIEVPSGKFDCIIIEPLIKDGGLFKGEGRIVIWMTNDERKVPVKVQTKISIGKVDAELKHYNGVITPWRGKL